jgi:hypothetical protein
MTFVFHFFFKLHTDKAIIVIAVVLLKEISLSIRYSVHQMPILGGYVIGYVLKAAFFY